MMFSISASAHTMMMISYLRVKSDLKANASEVLSVVTIKIFLSVYCHHCYKCFNMHADRRTLLYDIALDRRMLSPTTSDMLHTGLRLSVVEEWH